MPKPLAPLSALCVLAFLSLATGCSPCTELCKAQGATYERCLTDWGMEWTELGEPNRSAWEAVCTQRQTELASRLGDEDRQSEEDSCAATRAALDQALDCNESHEALSAYGEAP